MQPRLETLGEYVGELVSSVDTHKTKVTMLDCFVGEVLPDIDVLCALPSSDDIVAPLDTCVIILIYWSPSRWCKTHVSEQLSKVYDFYRRE